MQQEKHERLDMKENVKEEEEMPEKREKTKTENDKLSSINVFQSRLSMRAKRTIEGTTKTVVENNENIPEHNKTRTDSYQIKKKIDRTDFNTSARNKQEASFFERRKNQRLKAAQEHKQSTNEQVKQSQGKQHGDKDVGLYKDIFAAVASTKCPPEKQKVKGKIFNRRHVNQLFIRGDNIVMVGYENPDDAKKVVPMETE